MRTNLNVKFADKDKVKTLGAQWDNARKVWYIENVDNIEQFLPWIPEHLKKPSKPIKSGRDSKYSDKRKKED